MIVSLRQIQLVQHTRMALLQTAVQMFIRYENRVKNLSSTNERIMGIRHHLIQN